MPSAVRLVSAVVFLLIACVAAPLRAQSFVVQANPPALTPEAALDARAQTIRAGSYFFSIRADGVGPVRQTGPLMPDAAGRVAARILIGTLVPGSYTLVLSQGAASGGVLASTPLTITPAISVKGLPDPAQPGNPMVAEVSGLRTGTARVRVNGVDVTGDVAVTPATSVIPYVLPVATPPAASVPIEVRNFDGDQLVGFGRGSFRVSAPAFSGPARLLDLTGVPAVFAVNQPFSIAGRVELRRGSPEGMIARLTLRLPNGRSLILDDGRGRVAADGGFQLRGRAPSVWNGAPLALGLLGNGQGEVAIVLVDPQVSDGRRGASFPFPLGSRPLFDPSNLDLSQDIGLDVRVRDPDGNPVANTVVTLFGEPGAVITAVAGGAALRGGTPSLTTSGQPTLVLKPGTQTLGLLQEFAPRIADAVRSECPVTLYRGKTDALGNLQVRLSKFASIAAKIKSLNADISDGSPDHDTNVPLDTQLRLRLSPLGAGPPDGNGFTFANDPGTAQAAETYLTYSFQSQRWCFEADDFGGCTQVLPAAIPTLSYTVRPYIGSIALPITPLLPGLPRIELETLVDRYGPITTFPGSQFDDAAGLNIGGGLDVGFTFDQLLFGILQQATLSYRPPGGDWGVPMPFQTSSTQPCANVDETEYRLLVPNLHRFAWTNTIPKRWHGFRIDVRSGQRTNRYEFNLEAEPPPGWWLNPPADAVSRRVDAWKPSEVKLSLELEPAPVEITADLSEIGMGSVNNRNNSAERWSGRAASDGSESFNRAARNNSRAANEDGTVASATVAGLEASVTIGPETIIDTGWVPLFRAAWGVPPIASATFGIDAFFLARVQFDAMTRLLESGQLQSSLAVTPTVEGAIKAFLNVSAVLGLVDLTAKFTPSFALSMPIQVSNGASVTLDECFRFAMDVEYEVSVGLCDFCISASDQQNLFTERAPAGCTIPPSAASAPQPTLGALGIRRYSAPSVAFDALGAGSLVRIGDSGALEVRPWVAGQFGAAQALANPPVGAATVRHAIIGDGRALMVYERSSLAQAAFLASSIEQGAASRYMAWRLSNGGTWGAEQSLSAPGSGGEGQVSLAVCPATRSGCPSGGEVLAVWIRNPDGAAFGFRYEVWHALFRNNAWTVPARLADPGSGADMHPQAAYIGATPIATFTRASERSIGGQATRSLMYRVLPAGAATMIAGTSGAQWQALTVDGQGRPVIAFTAVPAGAALAGNQTVMMAARGTCTGSSCTFAVEQQRDALGRSIRAEAPDAEVLGDGSVRVVYRALGFGPNAQGVRVAPGDTEGLITGVGELAQLVPNFSAGLPVLPQALTSNSLLNFNPVLARNPANGMLVVLADQAIASPVAPGLARTVAGFEPARTGLKAQPVAGSLVQLAVPDAPEFSIDAVLPLFEAIEAGTDLNVEVVVRNSGRRWVYDGRTPLRLEAAWDGAPGAGAPAGAASVTAIPDSGQALVRITLRAPADAAPDQRRSVHVRVNADAAIVEADGGNNDAVAVVGGLPQPTALEVVERRRDRTVLLQWNAPADPRIAGYRIWRAPPPGAGAGEPQWFPVGTSFGSAFADLTGDAGQTNWYRVSAYATSGLESPPSAIAIAARDDTPTDEIFAASYESARDIRVLRPVVE